MAYSCLHLIKRNVQPSHSQSTERKLYVSLVRSNLSYCSQLWRPQFHKDIVRIKQNQRQATKYVLGTSGADLDYKSRLIKTNLLPIMFWYEVQDVLFFVKCLVNPSENFDIKEYIDFSTSNTRLSTYNKLMLKRSRTNTF